LSENKDYYRVLEVVDDAEDIVIRGAYRALAQRYHPDKWSGDEELARTRMEHINEAYAILSDPISRQQYDSYRTQEHYEPDPYEKLEDSLPDDELDESWKVFCEYYPDLVNIYRQLQALSSNLAFTYKLTLLNSQALPQRLEIAQRLEKNYLEKYFGNQTALQLYAKDLLLHQRTKAVRELNRVLTILGNEVDPLVVVRKIEESFAEDFSEERTPKEKKRALKNQLIKDAIHFQEEHYRLLASQYVALVGGKLAFESREILFLWFFRRIEVTYHLSQHGQTLILDGLGFVEWLNRSDWLIELSRVGQSHWFDY
jgi:curved DNA-binding protein CbpA